MPPDTPPPTTYDHKPAYDFAHSLEMEGRADGHIEQHGPYWHRWALVEAYMAGRAEIQAELERAKRAEMDAVLSSQCK